MRPREPPHTELTTSPLYRSVVLLELMRIVAEMGELLFLERRMDVSLRYSVAVASRCYVEFYLPTLIDVLR